jgi:serine protease
VVTTDTVQKPAPWGLDYVDNPKVNLDNKYQYKFTGMGVDVFVLDTGMLVSHDEFGGRASCGFTAFDGDNCVDDYNHGTHVAGTIGVSSFLVAFQ